MIKKTDQKTLHKNFQKNNDKKEDKLMAENCSRGTVSWGKKLSLIILPLIQTFQQINPIKTRLYKDK